jgi:S-DNA-T family DNA segregation ATPase FtsK/SpoIIIE
MTDIVDQVADPIDLDAHRARRDDTPATPAAVAGALAEGTPATSDTAYEVALDEDTEPSRTSALLVDLPSIPAAPVEGARVPIIPVHLRPENLKTTVARASGRAGHVAAFHAVRSPWYGCKLAFFAGRGLVRLVGKQVAWWWVPNSFALEQQAADAKELREWEKIHRQLKATRLWRGIVLAFQNLALVIGVPIVWAMTRPWTWRVGSALLCWRWRTTGGRWVRRWSARRWSRRGSAS